MIRSTGRRLLAALAPPHLRASLVDDFDEAFDRHAGRHGLRAARAWYRRQLVAAVVPLLLLRIRTRSLTVSRKAPMMSLDSVLQDVRYAIRMLRKSPGFAVAAIGIAALGIAINTSIFSVVYGLLLKPLPYPESERIVMVWQDMRARGGPPDEWATPGNFVDWSAQTSLFSHVASIRGWGPTLTGQGDPEAVTGEQVTQAYFDALGVRPAHGRFFRADECVPNAPRVVVLSYDGWMRRFGGDPAVLGRALVLGGEPHEVIGVAPRGFRPVIAGRAEFWRPDRLNLANPSRGAIVLRVVARLQPGVTVARADAELRGLARELETQYPAANRNVSFSVISLHERVVGSVRPGLLVLLGAVVLVLLVGCVNIANLLLARASSRAREMAVRAALGAGRGRVIRQLLTESILLSAIGGVLGVGLSVWGVRTLVSMAPAGTPRLDAIGLDPWVLAFAALVTGATGVLFGLAPAAQVARHEQTAALKDSGRGTIGSAGGRLRRVLIVAEVAIALVLLVGGGLLLRSFAALQRSDLGFNPDRVLTAFVPVPGAKYTTPESRVAFLDRLVARTAALPGVERSAISSILPLAGAGNGGDNDMNFAVDGMPPPADGQAPVTWFRVVGAGYFETMQMTMTQGRTFQAGEPAPVVIVNQALANRYFNGAAVGGRIRFGDGPWFTIVGTVGDVKQTGARGAERMQTFIPYWLAAPLAGSTGVVLRTTASPEALGPALARAVREIDPDIAVTGVAPMTSLIASSIEEPRFLARITGIFAVLALLLAAIGVYGVMSFTVAQRVPELGVRLALGAGRADVFRLVFTDGLKLAGIGLTIGAVAASLLAPAVETLLFEVTPADPLTFATTAILLLLAATVAILVPARRATRIDPLTALRE